MPTRNDADRRIMEVIIRSGNCELEELVLQCEGLTWNQVFLAIDRLSRRGELTTSRQRRAGVYELSVSQRHGSNSVVGPEAA